MSTSIHPLAPTFAEIDASFAAGAAYKAHEQAARAFTTTRDDLVARVVKYYGFARPLIVMISMTPLISANWRTGVQGLIGAADALAAAETPIDSTSPDFKAGKDL